MRLVIFEDRSWTTLAPLSLSRPVGLLACGGATLLERQLRHLRPDELTLWVRPELAGWCRAQIVPRISVAVEINEPLGREPALLISARALLLGGWSAPQDVEPWADVAQDGGIVAAMVNSPGLGVADALKQTPAWQGIADLPHYKSPLRAAVWPWDLLAWNGDALSDDFAHLKTQPRRHPAGRYHVVNPEAVVIAPDVIPGPGCVLDASEGPVIVADGVILGANSVIKGPCWIGPAAQIMPLALIRGPMSISEGCTVGGEAAKSIILAFSNKAHGGYLGDSYLGQWVNLGAGTTTSNLKNTYGLIHMQIGSRRIDTGRQFLGSVIGDHTKTGIQTRLTTGTYIGYCCTLAESGITPGFVPSFSFWSGSGRRPYDLDKAQQMMTSAFARRERAWSEEDGQMLRYVSEAVAAVES